MKTVEQIIQEVNGKFEWLEWEHVAEKSLEEFVAECVAAVDAERGKDATAWFITGTQLGMPYTDVTQRQQVIDRAIEIGHTVQPLFLSPTIPEGMALVPVEPTDAMLNALFDPETDGDSLNEVDAYKAMIQAAGVTK